MLPVVITTIEHTPTRQFMTEVYEKYHRLVYYTVQKWTSKCISQEDVVQDVWVKLTAKADLLSSLNKPQLAGYIAHTARNTSFKHLERQSKTEQMFENTDLSNLTDSAFTVFENPEDIAIKAEWTQCIGQIWTKLPERDRLLLEGKYIFNQSNEELAEWMGCKPESIRMALTRAKRVLANELRKETAE